MLWERKGFPPPGSDGGKISFQDLIYENRLFLTPKFMRFKVGGPMETVAVVVIMAILFVLVDPIGNIGTSKSVMTSFQKGNDVVFAGFQKSYDFFSFVNANKGQIEGTISNTLQNARNTVNTPTTTN